MFAAREGRSNIGIPKSVGEKFVGPGHDAPGITLRGSGVSLPHPRVETTPPKPTEVKPETPKARMTSTARDMVPPDAAGIMFMTPDGRVLFQRRTDKGGGHEGEWDFPGGKLDEVGTTGQIESAEDAARREALEETGYEYRGDLVLVDHRFTDGTDYVTFLAFTDEFEPELSPEHDKHKWRSLDNPPKNLHPGVRETLDQLEQMGARLAHDAALALNYSSTRTYDDDGYLHIVKTPISKANVCPYVGREIPNCDALGLDPQKLYHLLRDPAELARGAASFSGKPILIHHEPTSADEHQTDLTVGSVMNPVYEDPYLYAELVIWPKEAIRKIENGSQKQLSSCYRYVADMRPGEFKGVKYDGVMRGINGNHVALVKEGRAGSDVMVGDAAGRRGPLAFRKTLLTLHHKAAVVGDSLEGHRMPKTQSSALSRQATLLMGALIGHLKGKLAQDAEVHLPRSLFVGITKQNYDSSKPVLAKALKRSLKGKLAQDASLQDIHGLLDSLSPGNKGNDVGGAEVNSAVPLATGHTMAPHSQDDEDMHGAIREHLMGKLAPDDIEDLIGKLKGGKKGEDQIGPGSEKGAQTETAEAKDEDDDDEDDAKDEITVSTGGTKESDPQFQAADDPPPFKGVPKVGKGPGEDRRAHDSKQKGKPMADAIKPGDKKVRQAAMDAALQKVRDDTRRSTIAELNGIAEARERVRPWLGQLPGAFDSAEAVLRHALGAMGVKDADKLPAAALAPIIDNMPKPSARSARLTPTTVAQDSKLAGVTSFAEMYPDAARIGLAS